MKTEVLKALRQQEGYISGQKLCEQLGVSRTAVWKVISQLKEEGYAIESVTNKGYCLIREPNVLSESEILSRIHTNCIGKQVQYFDTLDSTNTYCGREGERLAHGTLVVAEEQTAGLGSRGRSWTSPKGSSIYMSLLLKPDIMPDVAPRLTLVMALSVARAFRRMGVEVQIKWPNDIVIKGKKLVGILTEMRAEIGYVHQVVIGVGINVLTEQFPEELSQRATSVLLETGKAFSRAQLVAEILDCFEQDYDIFLRTCDLSELLEQYTQFSVTIGKEVCVLEQKETYNGRALGVNETGQLLVACEDGSVKKVFADEVSVRGIYGYV